MHAFKCPKCGQLVEADRAAAKTAVTCSKCGKVFLGSAVPTAAPPAGPRAPKAQDKGEPDGPLAALQGAVRETEEPPEQRRPKAAPPKVPLPPAPKKARSPSPPSGPDDPVAAREGPPPEDGGSPQWVWADVDRPDDAPAPATRYPVRRRRPIPPAMFISIGGLVPIFVLVVLVHRYWGTTYYEQRDLKGNVVFEGRITNEEARRRADQAKWRGAAPAAPMPPEPGAGTVGPHAGTAGLFESPPDRAPGEPSPVPPGPAPLKPGDTKIALTYWNAIEDEGSDGSFGKIAGRVRNLHARTVTRATLRVQIVTKTDGKPVKTYHTGCSYIPPGGSATFCVPYEGVKPGEIDIKISADSELADASLACWAIDTSLAAREVRDRRIIVLKGPTRNPRPFGVENAWVHAALFTDDRIPVGEVKGKLDPEHNGRIPPGKTAHYTVEFDTRDAAGEIVPAPVTYYELRIIGRREEE